MLTRGRIIICSLTLLGDDLSDVSFYVPSNAESETDIGLAKKANAVQEQLKDTVIFPFKLSER